MRCNCSTAGRAASRPPSSSVWSSPARRWIVDAVAARAIRTRRSSAFPRAPAASLRAYAAETGVDAIGLDETVDPAWAQSRTARRPAGPGQSRPAGADRRRRARCATRSSASLTLSPTAPTSSTWAMASSRRRRSRMSRSWSTLVKGAGWSCFSEYQRLPRRRLSVGQGGARHLRHLLDRRPVHRAALLHPSPGDDPGIGRGPRLDRARGQGAHRSS